MNCLRFSREAVIQRKQRYPACCVRHEHILARKHIRQPQKLTSIFFLIQRNETVTCEHQFQCRRKHTAQTPTYVYMRVELSFSKFPQSKPFSS